MVLKTTTPADTVRSRQPTNDEQQQRRQRQVANLTPVLLSHRGRPEAGRPPRLPVHLRGVVRGVVGQLDLDVPLSVLRRLQGESAVPLTFNLGREPTRTRR